MLVEKYRPKWINEFVGQKHVVEPVKGYLTRDDGIPHLMLVGRPGLGKTTLAHVIGNELFKDKKDFLFYEFNASQDRGIEIVRTRIDEIAKMSPVMHKYKIILMDEADHITPDAQACFRRMIEVYQKQTRFIFTCNYPYKIIEPLFKRFVAFEFKKIEDNDILEHLKKIAKAENIPLKEDVLLQYVKKANGDIRNAVNMLDSQVKEEKGSSSWDNLTWDKFVKMHDEDKFELVYKDDPEKVFENIWNFVKKEKQWKYIPLLCDTQYKMNYAAIKVIPLLNCLTGMK